MQRVDNWVTRFEENVIALLLAAMTIVTFTQVVARYGFNSGWTGALELTRILFAWLILFVSLASLMPPWPSLYLEILRLWNFQTLEL